MVCVCMCLSVWGRIIPHIAYLLRKRSLAEIELDTHCCYAKAACKSDGDTYLNTGVAAIVDASQDGLRKPHI